MEIFCERTTGRDQSAQAADLLLRAVKALYHSDPGDIAKDEYGKPYFPEKPDIFFSLSHTASYVICAVGSSPVGIDVQIKRPVSPLLAGRVCDESELEQLDFYTLWSLKESYIKLYGKKDREFSNIRFYSDGDGIRCFDEKVFCKSFDTVPGCSCAVCGFEPDFPDKIIFSDGKEDFDLSLLK